MGLRYINNKQEVKHMTLIELQKILGDRIEIATNKSLPDDERKRETDLSQTIASLAKQMINNADIVLRSEKLIGEGLLKDSAIEQMIK